MSETGAEVQHIYCQKQVLKYNIFIVSHHLVRSAVWVWFECEIREVKA